ncbi:pentatricopeptide repeat-containing protein At1g20230-like [Typha angustifolia]|uniref:pentatricopeptide repeat-containing protein At1g20230-like n=1 Tax=Typha angustifolia TaxID=59011 RepID=UPI003C2AC4BC
MSSTRPSSSTSSLFLFLRSLSLPPNPFLLPSALKACATLRSLFSGRQLHCIASISGLSSDPFLESPLVNMYLKCGCSLDAHRVFDKMTQKRVHNNVRLGEIAADKLFQLELGNAGNYVLLSNTYAAKGVWEGVGRVRGKMKRDKMHPQMTQIIERLEKLTVEMRKFGYLPSTDFVLQDVVEQEKDHILCGHSEKLAVALGFISTSAGTSLWVIKNLRIYGDCHINSSSTDCFWNSRRRSPRIQRLPCTGKEAAF